MINAFSNRRNQVDMVTYLQYLLINYYFFHKIKYTYLIQAPDIDALFSYVLELTLSYATRRYFLDSELTIDYGRNTSIDC